MTHHLSSQEFVNALDRELTPVRQSHLDGCQACQAQVEELRGLLSEAEQGAEMPEPSPLFWDHFQARVLAAVEVDTPAERQAWWKNWAMTRTWLTAGAAIIAVVASAGLYLNSRDVPAPESPAEAAYAVLDNDEWEFVTSVMGTLESDDIHQVLTPSRDAVDAAFEGLTETERETFIKLLKAEMGQGTVQ